MRSPGIAIRPPTGRGELRDDDRPDAEAGGATRAQQDVAIAKAMAVGVDRDLRDLRIVGSLARMFSASMSSRCGVTCGPGNEPVHERVERERVVRARGEGEVYRGARVQCTGLEGLRA